MATIAIQVPAGSHEATAHDYGGEAAYERWKHWPVNWTAIMVGVFAGMSAAIVFAVVAVGIGAEQGIPDSRLVDLHSLHRSTLIFAVFSAFFTFVIGGWIAVKIAGILHSEPAMLHGAIVWAVAVPLLALLSAIGAGGYSNAWMGGLASEYRTAGTPPFERPIALAAPATDSERLQYEAATKEYERNIIKWRTETPLALRNAAILAATALLLGLMGSVVGGWMGCGEPMSPWYRRTASRSVI